MDYLRALIKDILILITLGVTLLVEYMTLFGLAMSSDDCGVFPDSFHCKHLAQIGAPLEIYYFVNFVCTAYFAFSKRTVSTKRIPYKILYLIFCTPLSIIIGIVYIVLASFLG